MCLFHFRETRLAASIPTTAAADAERTAEATTATTTPAVETPATTEAVAETVAETETTAQPGLFAKMIVALNGGGE